jgi:SAM-dependent methyltransferase
MNQETTKKQNLDDPEITIQRIQLLKKNLFINLIYQEWYTKIAFELNESDRNVIEIGSGAGFLENFISTVIKSDIFYLPCINAVINGTSMPFMDGSINAIVATDVFHHIPEPRRFLSEANRILKKTGKIVLIEPWHTSWSSIIYRRLHKEPFEPEAKEWEFSSNGPLSSSNQALPWIVFSRDCELFSQEYPQLRIIKIEPFMPFRYLLSGGFSSPQMMPDWSFSFWRSFEKLFTKNINKWAMFALIVVEKN